VPVPSVRHPRGGEVGLVRRNRTKPLIAAVEVLCGRRRHGAGPLCATSWSASRAAQFGLPEVKRGLIPTTGGTFRSVRHLPPNGPAKMLLHRQFLSAERAERLGFVNRITEPGDARAGAIALAEQVCTNAPRAVQAALASAGTKW